jgi:hypothetical protein
MSNHSHTSNTTKGSNVSGIPNLSNSFAKGNSPAMSSNSDSHGSPLDLKMLPNPNVTSLNTRFTTSSPPIPSVFHPSQHPIGNVLDMAQQQPQQQQQPAPNYLWANAGSGAMTFQDYSGPNLMNLGMRP